MRSLTFKHFLAEQDQASPEMAFNDFCWLAKRHCQPFLNHSHGEPLYRGMVSSTDVQELNHPRMRVPIHSDASFNALYNIMGELALGVEGLRARSLFVTGDKQMAEAFGDAFYCFPQGNIEFIYSYSIIDPVSESYLVFRKLLQKFYEQVKPKLGRNRPAISPSLMRTVMGQLATTPTKAFIGGQGMGEAVRAAFVASLDKLGDDPLHDSVDGEVLYEGLKQAIREVFAKIYTVGNDSNLQAAILTGKEIMIWKSEGYFMVNRKWVKDAAEASGDDVEGHAEAYTWLLKQIESIK